MVEFSLPDDHQLKDDPEMALILGYCLSEWDRIEHSMVLVFTGLLGIDYFKAERVFWAQRGFGGRCDMIIELCKRPGAIDKELHDQITSYIGKIRTLSKYRNLLVHGLWFVDGDTGLHFRAKLQPDMLMYLLDEKNKFGKEEIKEIGAKFTNFRREFVQFALEFSSAKFHEMVAEKMALATASNRGMSITLGHQAGGATEVRRLDDGPDGHDDTAQDERGVEPEGPRSIP